MPEMKVNQEFIDELMIHEVYQIKESDSRIVIFFTLENQKYRFLITKDKDELFREPYIFHEYPITCSFCQSDSRNCCFFEPYLPFLFNRLIEFPSIRLEWLYIPHAVQLRTFYLIKQRLKNEKDEQILRLLAVIKNVSNKKTAD